MELKAQLAKALNLPVEVIGEVKAIENCIWFSTTAGANYSAMTVRNGSKLKANSVRAD